VEPDHLHLDIISCDEAGTLPGLLAKRIARSPDSIAYQQYHPGRQQWDSYTWQQVGEYVARWHAGLAREALRPGDRVAAILPNSVEWVGFDQAALALGLVVVALYTTDTPDNLAYVIEHSGTRLLVIDSGSNWEHLAPVQEHLGALQRVICLRDAPDADNPLVAAENWLPATATATAPLAASPDALATLIYTSGTTGRPKGVMLSHRNILWNAEAVLRNIPAYREDVFLSFLPMAHSFERTVEYYLPMMSGARVAFARSVKELIEDLATIRPTVLLSPPRIYEKIYAAVQEKTARQRIKRRLLDWAVALGWREFEARQRRGVPLSFGQRTALRILRLLVSQKILRRLGGRIRVAVTGAAPLSEAIARFFLGLGLPLIEGYGLTESAPTVSGNALEDNVPGSVGPPLPGVEVKLGESNELLVRSPSVMLGYWRQAEATAAAIDDEGWLHTGDRAEIRDGRIYIRGRLKEVLVTSTGEKISPQDMEMAITLDALFEQALVVGEGKPFLGALLVVNATAWRDFAESLGVDPDASDSLHAAPVTEAVLSRLSKLLKQFPGYAQVHAVKLLLEPWSIEEGMLTPTLKLKRERIERRFAKEIEALYIGHPLCD